MILDKLENADWYYDSVPGLEQFMKFFRANDLEEMPACKIFLDGNDLIVNINDFKGKEEAKCRMDAYFTMDCANAHIETENCGNDAHVTCIAPEGFAYASALVR